MSILPLLPIFILLGGVLVIMLSRAARFVHYDAIATAASLLALLAMAPLAAQASAPLETLVSPWQPVSMFGTPVSLRIDGLDWLMGFIAITACASTALAGIAYPGRRRYGPRALALGMTASLVAAFFSANLLTLALAWGVFDALFAIAVLMRSEEPQAGHRAAFAVAFNTAATISLWIAALAVNESHQSQYWHLTSLPATARDFMVVAAILRLGLYPLSRWLPAERDDTPSRAALLYILPPLAGFHILMRLAGLDALPQEPTLIGLAALSVFVGGILAWWRSDTRDALPYVSLGTIGAVVLAGTGERTTIAPQAVLASGAVSWSLGILTLSLSRGFDRKRPWWAFGYALAAATLVGLPATTGLAAQTSLASNLAASSDVLLTILVVAGETLIIGALIRMATAQTEAEAPSGRIPAMTYATAIGLAALPPFLLPAVARTAVPAITPPSFEVILAQLGAVGSLIVVAPIVAAVALEWFRRDRPITRLPDPSYLLGLDWLYSLVFRIASQAQRVVSGLATVVEGESAMLWALLLLIATYVVLSGAIP